MAVNLPPQAYTRDVLGQAYEWLQNQPPKIKELATSMDAMVTLYLQHRRRSDSAPVSTTPISSQKFKEDLQTLANGIKQFDDNTTGNSYIPQAPTTPNFIPPTPAAPAPQATVPSAPAPSIKEPTFKAPQATAQAPKTNNLGLENLDARSLESLETVRKSLNLSSHEEALRMLVEIGFSRVKEILPKS